MKVELQPYPAYHPVDSEWLSELPTGWKAIQLARLSTKLTNGFVGPTRNILREDGVRYLQSLHIHEGEIVFGTPYFVSKEWSNAHKKSELQAGDVLVVQTGADTGQTAAVTEEFAGCNCHALIIVSPKRRMIDGFFLSAVLRSHYGYHSLHSVRTGALHPHLNCTKVRDVCLPVPPLDEQRSILAFLDRETAKIDRLTEVRWKQLERLDEQRTSVIHHAVTKGLNSRPKLKSSGVEWLGEIPEDWRVQPLWSVARMTVSNVDKHSIEDEVPVRLCNYVDVYKNERIDGLKGFMEATATPSEIKKFLLYKDDVVITKDSEDPNDIAIPAIILEPGELLVCGYHLAILRAKPGMTAEFLFRLLQTVYLRSYFATKAQGVTRFGLSQNAITRSRLPLPPVRDQIEITAHIKHETAKLDSLTDKYRRELDLLADYRASLISHSVTGKVDVRGLVLPVNAENL